MPKSWEELQDLREGWKETLPPEQYRQRLVDAVAEMVPGDLGRAECLVWLATDFDHADPEECFELARQAQADGGPTTIDPRAALLHTLIRLGRTEEADQLFRDLLRSPSRDDVTVGLLPAVGEVMAQASRLRDAHRAYTVGLRDLDPETQGPQDDTMDEIFCLGGRYDVRRALGLGLDRYDRYYEDAYPDTVRDA